LKRIITFTLCFVLTGFCFAEDNRVLEVQLLIQNGLKKIMN
jgi:hypothetical protein